MSKIANVYGDNGSYSPIFAYKDLTVIPPLTVVNDLLLEKTAGTYPVVIDKPSLLEVLLVGGGGGGSATASYPYYDFMFYTVSSYGGASGAAYMGEIILPQGSYSVSVGDGSDGGTGGTTSFAGITCTGGAKSSPAGKVEIAANPVFYIKETLLMKNGNNGGSHSATTVGGTPSTSSAGGASVSPEGDYGAGASCSISISPPTYTASKSSKGTTGFARIKVLKTADNLEDLLKNTNTIITKCSQNQAGKCFLIKGK